MSYVNELRLRRKAPNAAWHKLRTSISAGKFNFYAAFEGEEDEEFYSYFLSARFSDKKFRPIICDGKGGVLALHDKVQEEYGEHDKVFFFVDKDHDEFLEVDEYPRKMFATCNYSIENYLYEEQAIVSGIKKIFQLNPADDLWESIMKSYRQDSLLFETRSREIMMYAIALRVDDENPKLDEVSFNEIFEYLDGSLAVKEVSCAELIKLASTKEIELRKLARVKRIVGGKPIKEYIRGKLISQFIAKFFDVLPQRFSGVEKINGKPLKAKVQVGKKNLVSILVEFVTMPPRLSKFFDLMEADLKSIQL